MKRRKEEGSNEASSIAATDFVVVHMKEGRGSREAKFKGRLCPRPSALRPVVASAFTHSTDASEPIKRKEGPAHYYYGKPDRRVKENEKDKLSPTTQETKGNLWKD